MPSKVQAPAAGNFFRGQHRRRRGAVRIGCVLFTVLPVVLFVAAMFWYDRTAVTVPGVIVRKQERVNLYTKLALADEPYVERELVLHVRYSPPGSPEIIWGVRAAAARYDIAHVGDAVSLHYLRAFPRITIGLAERTVRDRLNDFRVKLDDRNGKWLFWSLGGLLLMFGAAVFGNVALLLVSLAWLASAWPLNFLRQTTVATSPTTAATAVVGDVVYVTKTPRWSTRSSILDGRQLTVPYAAVELTYIPFPGGDSVRATDAVDSASTSRLKTGAVVAIRYDRAAPRQAELQQATRTFRTRNRYNMWPETVMPAIFGVIGALIGFRRKPRTASNG